MSMARTRKRNRRVQPEASRTQAFRMRQIFGALILLSAIVVTGTGISVLFKPHTMPIREVRIEGTFRELTPTRLETIVHSSINGGFFSVDVESVRDALLTEPWVQDVSVQRIWPSSLLVSVSERNAIAYWRGTALLDSSGQVFSPAPESIPSGLISLRGPLGSESLVLDRFRELGEQLSPLALRVSELELSDRGAWRFRLVSGPQVIVGREDFHIRLRRFASTIEQLRAQSLDAIKTIDLRYTNGLAVAMKQAATKGDA